MQARTAKRADTVKRCHVIRMAAFFITRLIERRIGLHHLSGTIVLIIIFTILYQAEAWILLIIKGGLAIVTACIFIRCDDVASHLPL